MARPALVSLVHNVSMKKLQTLYKKEKNVKAKLRLLAAIKRKEGKNIEDIAHSLNKPVMTVHNWLRRFNEGIQNLYDKSQPGRPGLLTKKQLKQLNKDLVKGPEKCGYKFHQLWTRRLIEDLLRNKYKVSYTEQHTRRLLNNLGFSFVKPRRKHYKSADKRSQERFKKTLGKRSDTGRRKDILPFVWTRVQ